MKKHFLKKLGLFTFILLVLSAGIVAYFDPFFHYHRPFKPMKAVLTQAEYQVIGTIRTFEYDSLIVGSSMAENYYNTGFNNLFNCVTIKAVKPAANTADLMYLLGEAYKEQEIKKIFYNLDISALTSPRRTSFVEDGMPIYLYNENPLDDIKYLLNKDILFEDIPYMIARSVLEDYDEGYSFNWSEGKNFNQMYYEPVPDQLPVQTKEEYGENIDYNINLLIEMVKNHPETEFIFIVPPYSSLWWYESDRKGETEANFYALERVFQELLLLENVEIHYFQHLEDIMGNLDFYMDLLHFHPDINTFIMNSISEGKYRLTRDNMNDILQEMKVLKDKCIDVYAKKYFDSLQK